jgi:deoxyribodipyrimidine photo-lyase
VASIIWFRRDLRLADHPALHAALADGPAVPVFVLDDVLWQSAGPRRRSYLAASLRALSQAIGELGGPGLTVLRGDPATTLPAMARDLDATIYATADFGPYGARRDDAVAAAAPTRFLDSPFLHPPGAVRKADGTAYRVFTPFYRAWHALPVTPPLPPPTRWPAGGSTIPAGAGWAVLQRTEPPGFAVGERAAQERWRTFAATSMADYRQARDYPDRAGTSELSAALKFGEIHPRAIVASCVGMPGAEAFVRQLGWRDFYGHLLAELPDTARRNFQPAFDAMPWERGPAADDAFRRWQQGVTGYPFVDAAMRQLAATGTLPNRARMVVASFLVKDLQIDWRRGAAHFMQQLYDGDLANNSHGWQWTAGTGTDAAPYYRIFNPVTQGLRFDPEGAYVHRWIPELRDLPGAAAHQPWEHPHALWEQYPQRIVDHAAARTEALARYELIRVGASVSPPV